MADRSVANEEAPAEAPKLNDQRVGTAPIKVSVKQEGYEDVEWEFTGLVLCGTNPDGITTGGTVRGPEGDVLDAFKSLGQSIQEEFIRAASEAIEREAVEDAQAQPAEAGAGLN